MSVFLLFGCEDSLCLLCPECSLVFYSLLWKWISPCSMSDLKEDVRIWLIAFPPYDWAPVQPEQNRLSCTNWVLASQHYPHRSIHCHNGLHHWQWVQGERGARAASYSQDTHSSRSELTPTSTTQFREAASALPFSLLPCPHGHYSSLSNCRLRE